MPLSVSPSTLTVHTGTRPLRVPTAGTIQSVEACVGTAPGGQSVIVDLNKNGSTMFTTQAGRPAIPAGSTTSGRVIPSSPTFAAGDALTVAVDQIGTQPATVPPTIVGWETQALTSSVSSYAVTVPAGIQVGDLLIASIRCDHRAPSTVPSGWTLLSATGNPNSGYWIRRYWKRYAGEAGPYTWTWATVLTGVYVYANKVWLRNADPAGTLTDVSSVYYGTAPGPFTPAALTTTKAGGLVLYFATLSGAVQTSLPAGYTRYAGFPTPVAQPHLAYKTQATAGVVTASTTTPSSPIAEAITRVAVYPAPVTAVAAPGKDLTVVVRYLEA